MAWPLWTLFGASLAINVLALTGPIYALEIYDRVLPSRSTGSLIAFTCLAAVLLAAFAALEFERGRLIMRLSGRLGRSLEPTQRERLTKLAERNVPAHAIDLVFLPAYALLAVSLHPALGMALVTSALVLAVISHASGRKHIPAALMEASPSPDAMCSKARAARAEALRGHHIRAYDATHALATSGKLVRLLAQSAMLGIAALLAVRGLVSAGCIMAMSVITARALAPVEPVVTHWRSLAALRTALRERETSNGPVAPHLAVLMPGEEGLVVERLSLAPGEVASGPPLSFKLARGDALGIIGPSGSGKSRLLDDLAGISPIAPGSFRLDGCDLALISHEERDQRIGYLPQSPRFAEGTLREIITRFDPTPDVQALADAARLARIETLAHRLPRAFETVIDPATLSPGYRQRLALARALYRTPTLTLLDEPFAHMDHEGDRAVLEAITHLRQRGSIVLVVAHRLSSLEPVNLVLALKDSRHRLFASKDSAIRLVPTHEPSARRDAS